MIVGNGVAGVAAALRLRELSPSSIIKMVSAESPLFFSRTALMYLAMGEMEREDLEPFPTSYFAEKKIELLLGEVVTLDRDNRQITLTDGTHHLYTKLLLATGAIPKSIEIEGENLKGVFTLVSLQDALGLKAFINQNISRSPSEKKAVVVGGGLIGIEMVEVLLHYNYHVTFLLRGERFWPKALSKIESELVERDLEKRGVVVLKNTTLAAIKGEGCVKEITTQKGSSLPCSLLALAIGVVSNTALALKSGLSISRGIVVNPNLETSDPGVYAAGDCAEVVRDDDKRIVESIWYTSKSMGVVAAENMLGKCKMYQAGVWYNSAKFFDKEYTSVGEIEVSENDTHFMGSLEGVPFIVRVKTTCDNIVLGVSVVGVRLDSSKLESAILNRVTSTQLINNFNEYNYEPEFTAKKTPCFQLPFSS